MKPANDDLDPKLDALLRGLPREQAPARLTSRVLARVRRSSASRVPRLATTAAFALAVVAMLTLAPQVLERSTSPGAAPPEPVANKEHAQTGSATGRSIQDLESEYLQLRDELSALQRLHAATRPLVYLGGTEQADFVLDLERLARRRPGAWPAQHSRARNGQARRAAYSTGGSTP